MIFSTKIKLGYGRVFLGNYTDKEGNIKGLTIGELKDPYPQGSKVSNSEVAENRIYIEIPNEESLDVFQRAIDNLREKMRSSNEG